MSTTVFISHLHEEAALAQCLREQLEKVFGAGEPCIEFFESSQIDPGGLWKDLLDHALADTKIAVVLASEQSVQAPWVNFETGRAWGRKLVPVCHSGFPTVRLGGTPLSVPQALSTSNAGWFKRLVGYVEKEVGWRTSKHQGMTDEILLGMERDIRSVEASLVRRNVQPLGSRSVFVFERGDDTKCLEAMEHKLSTCKYLRCFGIGLHLFRRDVVLDVFCDRVLRGDLQAKVAMADWDSAAVQQRLRAEYGGAIPPNPEHVRNRLEGLQNRIAEFEFRLFVNPPPYALLIFDDVVFTYPYGLRTPGDHCPVFYVPSDKDVLGFYDKQFKTLWDDSRPVARRAIKADQATGQS
ncbi:MAG TPA: toll/interleukin-1 receptor domain-containing protein [Bryobacteraceae bacterium]|nr:toll/interleukin-1 receptor domain-containing protein [Bryobacteraceae bacterium]